MNTHEKQIQQDTLTLTTEKLVEISCNIASCLNDIWESKGGIEELLEDKKWLIKGNLKYILMAHETLEKLQWELDKVLEKSDNVSAEDSLRVYYILKLIYKVAFSDIARQARFVLLDIPNRFEDEKKAFFELVAATYKFLGYLENLGYSISHFKKEELPEDLQAMYDDFRDKVRNIDKKIY